MTESHSTNSTKSDYWDILARALPLAAVLLPVIGVGVRWLNFAFDSTIPSQVVLAASVPELAVTGFRPFLLMAPTAVLLGLFVFLDRKSTQTAGSAGRPSPPVWAYRTVFVLSLIAVVLIVWQGTLLALVYALGPSIAGRLSSGLSTRSSIGFGDVIPIVLVLGIAACVTSGLTPTTARAALFRFDGSAGLQDGWYLPLGTTEQGWYLRACAGDGRISLVKREALASVRFSENQSSARLTTIPDMLQGKPITVGFVSSCAE